MEKEKKRNNKVSRFFIILYEKLVKINDTPQKKALGLGLGVFSGILPGTGPLASLFLAFLFRANRASALIGSLLTNTWLSIITFLIAVKIGAAAIGVKWQDIHQDGVTFIKTFSWIGLFRISTLKIALAIMVGYLAIAVCLGLAVYLISLIILLLTRRGHEDKDRADVSC